MSAPDLVIKDKSYFKMIVFSLFLNVDLIDTKREMGIQSFWINRFIFSMLYINQSHLTCKVSVSTEGSRKMIYTEEAVAQLR